MNVYDAVKARCSVRAYKDKGVSQNILENIMKTALLSPSWANTQPWEFAIAGGETVKKLADDLYQHFLADIDGNPDIEMPSHWPTTQEQRIRNQGKRLFAHLKIEREDKERRKDFIAQMYRFFGAPNIIYVYLDPELGVYSLVDVGIICQSIALLATEEGLGTCFEAAAARYPDIVKKHLGIPLGKKLVLGIAIGYPNWEAEINTYRSTRDELENSVTWVDM